MFLQLDTELFEGAVYSIGNFKRINKSRIRYVQMIQLGLELRSQLRLWEDTQLLYN